MLGPSSTYMNSNTKPTSQRSVYDMDQAMRASRGYQMHMFFIRIRYLQYAFQENYKELNKLTLRYEKETFSKQKNTEFRDIKLSRTRTRNYRKKFIRHLLNFTSSSYALEESYKTFFKGKETQYPQVWTKFQTILEEPERIFIFALRNHMTHYKTLNVSVGVNHKKNTPDKPKFFITTLGRFTVDRSMFMRDSSRVYAEGAESEFLKNRELLRKLNVLLRKFEGAHIDLKAPLNDYYVLFTEHMATTDEEVLKDHRSDYDETDRLYGSILKRQSEIR